MQEVKQKVNVFFGETPISKAENRNAILQQAADIRSKIEEHKAADSYTEEGKNEAFAELTGMWDKYASMLKSFEFNFPLSNQEFDYIKNVILNKTEYTSNTIFLGLRLKEEFLKNFKATRTITAVNMSLLYHFIDNMKVTGLGEKSELFSTIVGKLGEMGIELKEYDDLSKTLSNEIKDWVTMCTPLDDAISPAPVPTAQAVSSEIEEVLPEVETK
jgi:hypothetical protein